MPYCQKCGVEVSEGTNFCPKCGAALVPLPPRGRREKEEKEEKEEKQEKTEKHEKGEYGYIGPLIGGIILIVVGLMAYLVTISPASISNWGGFVLIFVGAIILVIVIYAAITAAGRNPTPPQFSSLEKPSE